MLRDYKESVMRFERARDVLKHTQSFHMQLSQLYQLLADQENSPKVKLLLDYMVSNEQKFANTLEQYEANSSTEILDTWFQYTNDESILKIPKIEKLISKSSINGIVELSMTFSDELIELYESIGNQTAEINLKEIFTNLANMQKQEKRQLSMNIDRLMDL